MAFWDRFRRNRQSVLPEEVKQYYQSEQRQRRGVAIGLALLALVVTVAIAAGLFFAGRFAYDKITGDDDNQETAQTQDDFGGIEEEEAQQQGDQPAQPQPQPAPAPAPPPPAQPNPATPSLGDQTIPRTGDEGM